MYVIHRVLCVQPWLKFQVSSTVRDPVLFPSFQRVSMCCSGEGVECSLHFGLHSALGRTKVLSSIPNSVWRELSTVGCSKLFWSFCLVFCMFFDLIKGLVGPVKIEYCFFPALHCLNLLRASKEDKVFSKRSTGALPVWPLLCERMRNLVWTHPVWFYQVKNVFSVGHIAMVVQGASPAGTEEECLRITDL